MNAVAEAINPHMECIEHYLQEYQQQTNAVAVWLQQLRDQAMQCFKLQGFPTQRDEDWKYTNLAPVAKHAFKKNHLPLTAETLAAASHLLAEYETVAQRMVFVDGQFSAELSNYVTPAHAVMTSLAHAILEYPELVQAHLGTIANLNDHALTAFNTAFANDGLFLYLPHGVILPAPITLFFITTEHAAPIFNPVRNLIICEEQSQAVVVEHYLGKSSNAYFTSTVTELVLQPYARVEHYKLLNESERAFHIGLVHALQKAHSYFCGHSFALDGLLSRSDAHVTLAAEHAECELNGFYLTRKRQHVDHHTVIHHTHPHGTSREYYKGVLADHSRGVFNGKVIVYEKAQKTNAQQSNKNLLLSNDAEIDTKPQLEIFNDDVKCTHGATVGQLNEDALFYLCSRGIPEEQARNVLIYAFVKEMVERVQVPELKTQLHVMLNAQM